MEEVTCRYSSPFGEKRLGTDWERVQNLKNKNYAFEFCSLFPTRTPLRRDMRGLEGVTDEVEDDHVRTQRAAKGERVIADQATSRLSQGVD
jgi:hypothetical protein